MLDEAPHSTQGDEEYALPSLEALLAGTLALMTGVAQAPAGCDRVPPMAAKVESHLAELCAQPALSAPMRQMLARLSGHWRRLSGTDLLDAVALPERALWLPTPKGLQ